MVRRTAIKLRNAVTALSSTVKAPTKTTYYYVNITSKAEVENLFASIATSPDILINNAGFLAVTSNFFDADLNEYWKSLSTCSRYCFGHSVFPPSLPTRWITKQCSCCCHPEYHWGPGAHPVRVPLLSCYGASKAALARRSELISVDVSEHVARFISVHLGAVKTNTGIKSGLDGVFPSTDSAIARDFVIWTVTQEEKLLYGRFAWVTVLKGSPSGSIVQATGHCDPDPTQVIVKISHCEVYFTDEHYRHAVKDLDHEGIGTIIEVGAAVHEISDFRVGNRVGMS
ncbi:hypothetical protein CGRA01v4_10928 [Colletotrichum graminicola]|nr:hypothetical protein CGRA01v4_10928 [Colletotrichum graminicola]